MFWVIVGLALVLSLALIGMVLLQPSKGGGGFGSAFGGLGASLGSTFGSRRTLDFLAKGTAYTAGALALLCLLANVLFIPRQGGATRSAVTTGAAKNAPAAAPPVAPPQPGGQQSAPAPGGQPGGTQAPAGGQPGTATPPAGQGQPAPQNR